MINARRKLKVFLSTLCGLTLAWVSFVNPVPGLWGATSNTLPLDFIRSADCTGELVELNGTIHLVSQTQPDGSVVGHFNYQGVTGVGLTSGITYYATAVDHFYLSAPFPWSINSMRNFRLISQRGDSNLLVTILYHITVNANGEVTVSIDSLEMQCT
jgi:hypothetical protein